VTNERPEILPVGTEQEILFHRACARARTSLNALKRDRAMDDDEIDGITEAVARGVLAALRVMSGRQVAILLAQEASRHAEHVIREPPRYSAEEVADAR
jgi:hypothetical protein